MERASAPRGTDGERLPLFFICQNPACQKVVRVKTPKQQRDRRCCGPRCVAIVFPNLTKELRRKGGLTRARRDRLRIRARIKDLTPIQAFRKGYLLGLASKHRQLRKRAATA